MASFFEKLTNAATEAVQQHAHTVTGNTVDELVDEKLRPPTYELMGRNTENMKETTCTEVPMLTERAMLEEVDPAFRPIFRTSSQSIVGKFAMNLRAMIAGILRGIPKTLVDVAMNIVKVLAKGIGGTAIFQGFGAALQAVGNVLSNPYMAIVPQIITGVRQKVVEILDALVAPIMNVVPQTFDAAARNIVQGVLNSGNTLLTAATMVFGGLVYDKIRDAVLDIVNPKAWTVVQQVMTRTENTIMNEFEGQVNNVFGGKPSAGLVENAGGISEIVCLNGHPMAWTTLNPQQAPLYTCDRCSQQRNNNPPDLHARCNQCNQDFCTFCAPAPGGQQQTWAGQQQQQQQFGQEQGQFGNQSQAGFQQGFQQNNTEYPNQQGFPQQGYPQQGSR